ncbi:MAG: hypothetical protein ABH840_01485 [Nanoarchaeota archaeon]
MVNSRKKKPSPQRITGKAKSIRRKTSQRSKGKEKTKSTKVIYHSTKEIKVERALIENFIGLQRVMVNLSAKFDSLSSQISNLLQLFEISAKSLARKSVDSAENLDAKRVMEKLDNLSAQAGLIGKGLALIHEIGTETGKPIIPLNLQNKSRPMPQKSPPIPSQAQTMHPSIFNQKSTPKMAREITTERPGAKNMPGFNENAT